MKDVAAIILNRNLPHLADELSEWIVQTSSDVVDLYVVENGSDAEKYSKYANIAFAESYGPARGINEALSQLLPKGYEYFWINFNDVRYTRPDFLEHTLQVFRRHQEIGIVTGYWLGNVRVMGKMENLEVLSFFDPLGFVVSRRALEVCQQHPLLELKPLWDSSNFSNHYNILGVALALYSAGLVMVTDSEQSISELSEAADRQSEQARGFDRQTWKHTVGPDSTTEWLSRRFPDKSGDIKSIRDAVVKDIQLIARSKYPQYYDNSTYERIYQLVKDIVKAHG